MTLTSASPDRSDLTCDAFLGGRLQLWQPRQGYRAGIDPVLLAAAIQARPGQAVLDLGCGAGAALFCLGTRVPGVQLFGVELQESYLALARRNSEEAGLPATLHQADLRAMPDDVRAISFDHVFANPPYFKRDESVAAQDAGRETALGGDTPVAEWVKVAARRLKPRGTATFIQRVERLPEVLAALDTHLGSITVLPISARVGRRARLALVRAIKGGRAQFNLLPPLVLHEGQHHGEDGDDYRPEISQILREAAPLSF